MIFNTLGFLSKSWFVLMNKTLELWLLIYFFANG